ncbi:MAG TPA: hypothetical protein VJY62_05230 [Bacteroidia bacterium]|nr:hypothetical protein [Bacteroidia bacterium]
MKNTKKKMKEYIIPEGTQQETGVTRFIKKTKQTEIVKDAKINNKVDLKNKKEQS